MAVNSTYPLPDRMDFADTAPASHAIVDPVLVSVLDGAEAPTSCVHSTPTTGGGAVTVTEDVALEVTASSSVTVRLTVYDPAEA
jgi:hypothetical protein